jgi:hypothetical protein
MTRRSGWLGIGFMAIALTFAPQAAARAEPKAKFRIVSVSGRETLSFQEETQTSDGKRCVGTTESRVSWRSTRPVTVYVFVRRAGTKVRTILSADRVAETYESVPIAGEATVSRSISYQETAGCAEDPIGCPETKGRAKPFLTGTTERRGSVNGGIDVVDLPPGVDPSCEETSGIAAGLAAPFGGTGARTALGRLTVSAFAMPRRRLLDPRRKRIHDSVTVEQQLGGTYDGSDQASASGTYTDHLAIRLRRLNPRR